MKRLLSRIIIMLFWAVLLILVLFFSLRNQLLIKTVAGKTETFNREHRAAVTYKNVSFKGLKTIRFDTLVITTDPTDSLLFVESFSAGINLRQLFAGRIAFRRIEIKNAHIQFNQHKTADYLKAFSNNQSAGTDDSSGIDLYSRFEHIIRRAFAALPSDMSLQQVTFTYLRDSLTVESTLEELKLKHGKLFSTVRFEFDTTSQHAIIEGKVRAGQRKIQLSIKPVGDKSKLNSPVAALFDANLTYHSLTIDLAEISKRAHVLKLSASCSIAQFDIFHEALSTETISFPECSMNFNFSVGSNFIEFDSTSSVGIGKLLFKPWLKYVVSPEKTVDCSIFVPGFTADDFFSSLPSGLFPQLQNLETEGTLSYRAKLTVDFSLPDSLKLYSKLTANDFKIRHVDNELLKMKAGFVYTAYEKGNPVRHILVGPENPNFRPLEQIPVLLQHSVLLAEDDAFYYHKGFWPEAIQYALAQNIKEHRLKRGGSTISQQLIKNVYLSRDKTISRKLEEVMLVWLIESNRLVSKSRMFEVYLNIIEWGPGVYGVNEAARFYFNKDIVRLDESECIFLSSVIPSPKKFYYRFDENGSLAPFMLEYYNSMADKMYRRHLLPSPNGDSLSEMLHISGPADFYIRNRMNVYDTIGTDTDEEDRGLPSDMIMPVIN